MKEQIKQLQVTTYKSETIYLRPKTPRNGLLENTGENLYAVRVVIFTGNARISN